MRNLTKIIITFVLMLVATASTFSLSVDAANEKVSKIHRVSNPEFCKNKFFPLELTNGLSIGVYRGESNNLCQPILLKGKNEVYSFGGPFMEGYMQFTITGNKDTFMYYRDSGRGGDTLQLVGARSNGEVFLEKEIANGTGINAEFLSPNIIEIGIEGYNEDYVAMADKFTGIFDTKYFSLTKEGEIKELDYIDKEFADLAKKGQLKWMPGHLGMQYKSLKANIQGTLDYGEIPVYKTPKAAYSFPPKNKLEGMEAVNAISKVDLIMGSRKELNEKLQSYFGKPIAENIHGDSYVYAYKAGQYYVVIAGDAQSKEAYLTIGTKIGINILFWPFSGGIK
ncbi:hypothetical protein [Lysinibacillus sp. ZYM-1]|uniref:hypothetical protein n=1 Tax=Lysinibacillus sp. ZYM-1 TaxID=1681184 RepID=UPI0006CE9D6B|nr:hypothetical protein [Lysinibacillus sp. ZYM-1]KPN95166.1 hypothetical protein AO843_03015 [Lysinibacillus sp. ZYM-1]